MCRICDGFTIEEVIADDAAKIAEHGFMMQAVSASGRGDDPRSWVYTVGLLDMVGHPEMIVAGVDVETGGRVLSHLANSAIDDDERFEPGDVVELGTGCAEVGTVHAVHYGRNRGVFNVWYTMKQVRAVRARRLRAVQIFLPSELCPFGERSWQPDLSDPATRLG
ncbi:MAG TPA: DUF4262 domain-containing protein [Acidimicrobiia bacterium]|nr:DUF4262 domain-containing protein [Acidimicrobiia bacterium]